MKTLPARISISRPSRGDGKQYIKIEILDDKSHCQAVEVQIGYAEFAQALTGLGHIECQMEFNDSGIIGKKREHKSMIVKIPSFLSSDKKYAKALRAVLEVYEEDGWRAYDSSAVNPHNWTKTQEREEGFHNVNVTFTRYVEED